MKIEERDIAAIKALGYTGDEAHFHIVATHSGYFVPRQFLDLTGASWGYRTDQLEEARKPRPCNLARIPRHWRRLSSLFEEAIR